MLCNAFLLKLFISDNTSVYFALSLDLYVSFADPDLYRDGSDKMPSLTVGLLRRCAASIINEGHSIRGIVSSVIV